MIKITCLALGRHVTIRKEEEAGIKAFRKTLLWSGMSQMHMVDVAMETGKHKGTLHWQDYYLGLAVLSKIKRER